MALGKGGMSPDEIILKIKAEKSDAEKSVKSIRQELADAKEEAIKLGRELGNNAAQTLAAQEKAAGLKKEFQDFNNRVNALKSTKLEVFSSGVSLIARGFEAARGAAALFGADSKDLEKTLVKLQGAMAFADGIEGVKKSMKAFDGLGATIKTRVVQAFTTLKGAMIATGIGALTVGLGYLIANFEKVKKAVLNLVPGLATVGEFIGETFNAITDFFGVTSEGERQLEKSIENSKKALDSYAKWLDANGYKYDKYTQDKFKADLEYKQKVKELEEEALKERRAVDEQTKKDLLDKRNFLINQADQERKDAEDAAKKKADEEKKRAAKEADDKRKQAKAEADKLAKEQADRELANAQRRISLIDDEYKRELAVFDLSRAELRKKAVKAGEDLLLFDLETQNQRTDLILKQYNKELDAQIANNQKKLSETKAYYEADGELTLAELQIINDKQRQLLDEQFANNKISLEAYNAGILVIQKSQADKEKEIRDKEKAEKEKAISEEQSRLTTHYELLKLQAGNNMTAMLNILRDETAQNQLLLEKQLNDRLISEEQYQLKKLQLNAELENAEKAHRQALNDIAVNTAQNTFSSLIALNAQFSGKSLEAQKRAFKRNKALQIADSVINTYSSAVAAFAQGTKSGGPWLGAAYAAIAVAAGLANVAKIKAQKFEGDKGESGNSEISNVSGMGNSPRAAQTGFSTVGAPRNIQTTPQQPEEPKPLKVFVVQKDIAEATSSANSIMAKAIVK